MKNVLLFLIMIGLLSCSKQEELLQTTSLSGELKCFNNNALEGITIEAVRDSTGTIVSTVTNAAGEFTFSDLAAGNYRIHAKTANYYMYTEAQYDAITADMWEIVRGAKALTKQDQIAYHMIDFHHKITTYDKFLFEKLKDQTYSITDYMPWRIIHKDDFDNGNLYAVDTIPVVLQENIANTVDILAFYIGDPQGTRCQ